MADLQVPSSKPKVLLWIASVFLILCCLLLVFVLLLPPMLSSEWGRTKILEFVNSRISGSIEITSLKLSWFGDQSFDGLIVKDEQGQPAITCKSGSTTSSLWSWMKWTPHIGLTTLNRPYAHLETDQNGQLNINKIFEQLPSNNPQGSPSLQKAGFSFSIDHRLLGSIWKHFYPSDNLIEYYFGTLEVNDAEVVFDHPAVTQTRLSNLKISLTIPEDDKPITLYLDGLATQGTLSGQLHINALTNGANSQKQKTDKVNLTAHISHLPINAIDQLASLRFPQLNGLLTTALGNELDLDIQGNITHAELTFDGTLKTPLMTAQFAAKRTAETIVLTAPSRITLNPTDKFWKLLSSRFVTPSFQLKASGPIEIEVEELYLPLPAHQENFFDAARVNFKSMTLIPEIVLLRTSLNKPILFRNCTIYLGSVSTDKISPYRFTSTVTFADAASPEAGQIELKGAIFFPEGDFKNNVRADLHLDLLNIDTPRVGNALIAAPKVREQLVALLGTPSNLSLSVHHKPRASSFDLNLFSKNCKMLAIGLFNQNSLTLSETLSVEIGLTPSVSQLILKDINPLFANAIFGTLPIKLTIPQDGVFIPLAPFNLSKMTIPHATLDLGTIHFSNSGTFGALIGLLKSKILTGLSQMSIQFSPLNFQVYNGEVISKKMDGWIENSIQFSTWGKVNLINDQVDMTLALPGETLKNVLGLSQITPDYLLQIPLRGTTEDLTIDWGRAAMSIAKLLTLEKGGNANKFLSGILDLFNNNPQEKK